MDSSIVAHRLGKRYRTDRWGLRDASFELATSRLVGVVGPNGAGKSTMLNLLGGLLRPTEGEVRVVSANGIVGWCPQRTLIDWSLTVAENVRLAGQLTGLDRRRVREEVDRVLALLALEECRNDEAENLSGGQLQRTQIARALVSKPAVLILDEPANGLDPEGTLAVYEYLRAQAELGAIVLISSHDLASLEQYVTELLLVEGGEVRYSGPLKTALGSDQRVTITLDFASSDDAQAGAMRFATLDPTVEGVSVSLSVDSDADVAHFLGSQLPSLKVENIHLTRRSLTDLYFETLASNASRAGEDA